MMIIMKITVILEELALIRKRDVIQKVERPVMVMMMMMMVKMMMMIVMMVIV